MKRIYSLMIIIFFLIAENYAQPVFITDSLDNYVDRSLEQWNLPGAAVLVVKDGEVVVLKGYGIKELGKEDKVDENTLFMIASNTKAFVGTSLAMLEHDSLLKLSDKVVKYLPGFKMKDPWVTNELNLIDVVTHRMGLETFQGDFMYWTSELTLDEVIEKFGKITPEYNFREEYGYTNAGFNVAGKVIEKVSGKTWDKYVKEKFFDPLEMNRTVALSKDFTSSENISLPHTLVDGEMSVIPIPNIDNLGPAASISSSVKDLSHWVIAQLDSGRFNGDTIIPYDVIKRTREPETFVRKKSHPFDNRSNYQLYGLGWFLEDYEGREMISHTGGANGFLTSLTLIPEENLGVVVLTNSDQNTFFLGLAWEIIDAYLGLPYRDYSNYLFEKFSASKTRTDSIISSKRDSIKMNINPEISLSEFEGRYENEVYGYADLSLKNNYLEMTLQHHKQKGKLEYLGSNRFLCTYSDPTYGVRTFPFKVEDGKVISFKLYVDNFIEPLPYEFVKE